VVKFELCESNTDMKDVMIEEVIEGKFHLKFIRLEGDYNTYQGIGVDERFVNTNKFKKHSFRASNGYIISYQLGKNDISNERIYVFRSIIEEIEPRLFVASLEEFESLIAKIEIAIKELHEDLEKNDAFKPDVYEGKGRCTLF